MKNENHPDQADETAIISLGKLKEKRAAHPVLAPFDLFSDPPGLRRGEVVLPAGELPPPREANSAGKPANWEIAGQRQAPGGTGCRGAEPANDAPKAREPRKGVAGSGWVPPVPLAQSPKPHLGAFGDYLLLEELGQGGMSRVYLAFDTRLETRVALKVLRSGEGASEAQVGRFHEEAKAIARLSHPNIIRIYEVGTHEGTPFFTMEYIDGITLADLLSGYRPAGKDEEATLAQMIEAVRRESPPGDRRNPRHAKSPTEKAPEREKEASEDFRQERPPGLAKGGAPLPVARCLYLLERILDAVGHAHQRGIIHRDLKPGNVLLRPGGEPVVTDFGLARRLGTEGENKRLTLAGQVVGTPAYMSPEQARGEVALIDERSDGYAVGAMMYEMLTGAEVVSGSQDVMTALRRVVEEEPVPPRRLNPRIPRELETICLKALAKERWRRYPTVEAFAEDLRRHREGEPILARPISLAYRLRKKINKNPKLSLTVLSAAIIMASLYGGLRWSALRQAAQSEREAQARARAERVAQRERWRAQEAERRRRLEAEKLHAEAKKKEAQWYELVNDSFSGERLGPEYEVGRETSGEVTRSCGRWEVVGDRAVGSAELYNPAYAPGSLLLFRTVPRLYGDVRIDFRARVHPYQQRGYEIAVLLLADPARTTGGGYFISVQSGESRLRRLGAEVYGGPGYRRLRPGEWFSVRVLKIESRDRMGATLEGLMKPAAGEGRFDSVLRYFDPDPVVGQRHFALGFYSWNSRLELDDLVVKRRKLAEYSPPIQFALKAYHKGAFQLAHEEFGDVYEMARQKDSEAVHARFLQCVCQERLADEAPPSEQYEAYGQAAFQYKSFAYQFRQLPPFAQVVAEAKARQAICYDKRADPASFQATLQELLQEIPAPDRGLALLINHFLHQAGFFLNDQALEAPERHRRAVAQYLRASELLAKIETARVASDSARGIAKALARQSERASARDALPQILQLQEKLLALPLEDHYAYHDLAVAMLHLRRADWALKPLQKAAALNPRAPEIEALSGRIWWELGHEKEALACYRRALRMGPEKEEILLDIAQACSLLGDGQTAEDTYQRLIKRYPEQVEAHAGLAWLYLGTGRAEAGVRQLYSVLVQYPERAELYHQLLHFGRQPEMLATIERVCREAVEKQPNELLPRLILSRLLLEARQFTSALEVCRAALRLIEPSEKKDDPRPPTARDPRPYLLLGMIHLELNQAKQALPPLKKAADLGRSHPSCHLQLGHALRLTGDGTGAEHHYRQALQLNPMLADAYAGLGAVMLEAGKHEEALLQLGRAVTLDEKHGAAQLWLGEAFQASGKQEKAQSCYRAAAKILKSGRLFNQAQAHLRALETSKKEE